MSSVAHTAHLFQSIGILLSVAALGWVLAYVARRLGGPWIAICIGAVLLGVPCVAWFLWHQALAVLATSLACLGGSTLHLVWREQHFTATTQAWLGATGVAALLALSLLGLPLIAALVFAGFLVGHAGYQRRKESEHWGSLGPTRQLGAASYAGIVVLAVGTLVAHLHRRVLSEEGTILFWAFVFLPFVLVFPQFVAAAAVGGEWEQGTNTAMVKWYPERFETIRPSLAALGALGGVCAFVSQLLAWPALCGSWPHWLVWAVAIAGFGYLGHRLTITIRQGR